MWFFDMLNVIRPDFEGGKEECSLHLVSGYRRFKLVLLAYDEKSSLIDKWVERSNLGLIRDMVRIIKSEELLSIGE